MDAEPPPSYAQATGSSTTSNNNNRSSSSHQSQRVDASAPYIHENPEGDERGVPEGWIRQYDAQQAHSYFVDTTSDPPRSIWVHPYEDETYLSSLTSEERERIQEEDAARERRAKAKKSKKAEAGMDSEDGSDDGKKPTAAGASSSHPMSSGGAGPSNLASSSSQPTGAKKYGRKIMDKVTGMTHEERKAEKARRREEERQAYEASMAMRAAINRAVMTGQPQRVGRDKQGHDVYVEPPPQPGYNYGGYGAPNGLNNRGWGHTGPGPAMVPGDPIYGNPNARFVRPSYGYGYNRPYGPGRGGMGMPLAGGLLGGMLLGGLLF